MDDEDEDGCVLVLLMLTVKAQPSIPGNGKLLCRKK